MTYIKIKTYNLYLGVDPLYHNLKYNDPKNHIQDNGPLYHENLFLYQENDPLFVVLELNNKPSPIKSKFGFFKDIAYFLTVTFLTLVDLYFFEE